jgi:NADH-quinone oxidoreductase subunit N
LVVTAVIVVLVDLVIKQKGWLVIFSITGLIISAGFTLILWSEPAQSNFYGMLAVDSFALFFKLLFLVVTILVIFSSVDYVSKFNRFQGEYYALLLLACLGMILMASSTDLIALYIAVELVAIALFVLVGFLKDSKSTESSLKYLLISGIASAILIYGMALVFGFTGSTQLSDIATVISGSRGLELNTNPGLLLGMVLLIAGFGFKIAAVPFQFWVPDIFEGAPTPITLFLSVASKTAGFAIFLRVFISIFTEPETLGQDWGIILAVISAIGITLGNISAIPQTNIKRMLGYSSIAHAGYILVGVAAIGLSSSADTDALTATLFYLVAFAVSDLTAFISVIAISNRVGSDLIADFAGIGKQSPLMALALTLALISLTGFPPTVGFLAKFYIFAAGVNNGLLWLVVIAAINTAVSAYFYVNVIKVMWLGQAKIEGSVPASLPLKTALVFSSLAILILGIMPAFILDLAEKGAIIFIV